MVAKAPPDGHTLLAASISPAALQPLVNRTPFDAERELAAMVSYVLTAFVLLVRH